MLYLLLMHIALFHTWFISFLSTLLVSTGSAKLISLMQLLNDILSCLSNVHHHIFFWHDILDVTYHWDLELLFV